MAAMAARRAVAAVAAQQAQQQPWAQWPQAQGGTRGAMRTLVRQLVTRTPQPLGGHPQSIDAVLRSISAEIAPAAALSPAPSISPSISPSMAWWSDAGGGDADGDADGLGGWARQRLLETMRASSALAEEAAALPTCAGVLCLDEVQVADIADASIVRGLVDHLLEAGWVMVSRQQMDRQPRADRQGGQLDVAARSRGGR